MDDDDLRWLVNEFTITAERAQDRDITPAEFLVALRAYANRLAGEREWTAVE